MWLEWPEPKLVLSWALVYLRLCLSIMIIMVMMQQSTVTMAVTTPMMIITTSLSSLTITVWRAILLSAVLFSASLWVSASSVIAGPFKSKCKRTIQFWSMDYRVSIVCIPKTSKLNLVFFQLLLLLYLLCLGIHILGLRCYIHCRAINMIASRFPSFLGHLQCSQCSSSCFIFFPWLWGFFRVVKHHWKLI